MQGITELEIATNLFVGFMIAFFTASMFSRYNTFQNRKIIYIEKLIKIFYCHKNYITYCRKNKKNIFCSAYNTEHILELDNDFNNFLISLSGIIKESSKFNGTFLFMLESDIVFRYYPNYSFFRKFYKKNEIPLFYKNQDICCKGCEYKECTQKEKGGILFDKKYKGTNLPEDLVQGINKTIEYCHRNIKPRLLWIIFGNVGQTKTVKNVIRQIINKFSNKYPKCFNNKIIYFCIMKKEQLAKRCGKAKIRND